MNRDGRLEDGYGVRERCGADAASPTRIPLLGLDVAAGGFDNTVVDRGTRWVTPRTQRRLHHGCFAVFSAPVRGDPSEKIVLAEYRGLIAADTSASYTVKRFRGVRATDGEGWREITLVPDNSAFESIVVDLRQPDDIQIAAELVEVLTEDPAG